MRIFACIFLLALGCEGGEREAAAPEPPARAAEPIIPPETVPSPPEPRIVTDEAPTVPPPGMQQLGQALAEAAEAANEASAEGGSHCERAYNGAVAMARSLHERMGGSGEAPIPERARFMQGCGRLPPAVQQCMNIGYAVTHQDECRSLREETDPALMREVREMMGQGGS